MSASLGAQVGNLAVQVAQLRLATRDLKARTQAIECVVEKLWKAGGFLADDSAESPDSAYTSSSPTPILNKNKKKKKKTVGVGRLFDYWNENRGTLPAVKKLTEQRREKARLRLESYALGDLQLAIKKMAVSTFCTSHRWATFDWLVKSDTNVAKVLEGKYDDAGPPKSQGPPLEPQMPPGMDWRPIISPKLHETLLDQKEAKAAINCKKWHHNAFISAVERTRYLVYCPTCATNQENS